MLASYSFSRFSSNLWILAVITPQVLDWLLLPDILPYDLVGMPLALKVLAEGVNGFPSWKELLELSLREPLLLFFELGQDLHVHL